MLAKIMQRAEEALEREAERPADPDLPPGQRLDEEVARDVLRDVIEETEANPGRDETLEVQTSAHGASLFRHLKRENLEGLHIYPAEHGGWNADLSFKGLPPGVPRVIGTPSSEPCETFDEASEQALMMVDMILRQIKETERGNAATATAGDDGENVPFTFHDMILEVPLELLKQLDQFEHPGNDYCRQRLDEIVTELFGGAAPSSEIARKFTTDQMARFMSVAAMSLLSGIHRWPIPMQSPPKSKVN